jgi:hypothetical protein
VLFKFWFEINYEIISLSPPLKEPGRIKKQEQAKSRELGISSTQETFPASWAKPLERPERRENGM